MSTMERRHLAVDIVTAIILCINAGLALWLALGLVYGG